MKPIRCFNAGDSWSSRERRLIFEETPPDPTPPAPAPAPEKKVDIEALVQKLKQDESKEAKDAFWELSNLVVKFLEDDGEFVRSEIQEYQNHLLTNLGSYLDNRSLMRALKEALPVTDEGLVAFALDNHIVAPQSYHAAMKKGLSKKPAKEKPEAARPSPAVPAPAPRPSAPSGPETPQQRLERLKQEARDRRANEQIFLLDLEAKYPLENIAQLQQRMFDLSQQIPVLEEQAREAWRQKLLNSGKKKYADKAYEALRAASAEKFAVEHAVILEELVPLQKEYAALNRLHEKHTGKKFIEMRMEDPEFFREFLEKQVDNQRRAEADAREYQREKDQKAAGRQLRAEYNKDRMLTEIGLEHRRTLRRHDRTLGWEPGTSEFHSHVQGAARRGVDVQMRGRNYAYIDNPIPRTRWEYDEKGEGGYVDYSEDYEEFKRQRGGGSPSRGPGKTLPGYSPDDPFRDARTGFRKGGGKRAEAYNRTVNRHFDTMGGKEGIKEDLRIRERSTERIVDDLEDLIKEFEGYGKYFRDHPRFGKPYRDAANTLKRYQREGREAYVILTWFRTQVEAFRKAAQVEGHLEDSRKEMREKGIAFTRVESFRIPIQDWHSVRVSVTRKEDDGSTTSFTYAPLVVEQVARSEDLENMLAMGIDIQRKYSLLSDRDGRKTIDGVDVKFSQNGTYIVNVLAEGRSQEREIVVGPQSGSSKPAGTPENPVPPPRDIPPAPPPDSSEPGKPDTTDTPERQLQKRLRQIFEQATSGMTFRTNIVEFDTYRRAMVGPKLEIRPGTDGAISVEISTPDNQRLIINYKAAGKEGTMTTDKGTSSIDINVIDDKVAKKIIDEWKGIIQEMQNESVQNMNRMKNIIQDAANDFDWGKYAVEVKVLWDQPPDGLAFSITRSDGKYLEMYYGLRNGVVYNKIQRNTLSPMRYSIWISAGHDLDKAAAKNSIAIWRDYMTEEERKTVEREKNIGHIRSMLETALRQADLPGAEPQLEIDPEIESEVLFTVRYNYKRAMIVVDPSSSIIDEILVASDLEPADPLHPDRYRLDGIASGKKLTPELARQIVWEFAKVVKGDMSEEAPPLPEPRERGAEKMKDPGQDVRSESSEKNQEIKENQTILVTKEIFESAFKAIDFGGEKPVVELGLLLDHGLIMVKLGEHNDLLFRFEGDNISAVFCGDRLEMELEGFEGKRLGVELVKEVLRKWMEWRKNVEKKDPKAQAKEWWPDLTSHSEFSKHVNAFATLSLEEMVKRVKAMTPLSDRDVGLLKNSDWNEKGYVQTFQKSIDESHRLLATVDLDDMHSLQKTYEDLFSLPHYPSPFVIDLLLIKPITVDGFDNSEAQIALRYHCMRILRAKLNDRIHELEKKK